MVDQPEQKKIKNYIYKQQRQQAKELYKFIEDYKC